MEIPGEYSISAYDGLTGNEVALNIEESGNEVILKNFTIPDYPVYLDLRIPEFGNSAFFLY